MSQDERDDERESVSDSSSHEDELEDEPWVFYKCRPEWKDVKPLEIDEGSFPVVAIAYSDKCMIIFKNSSFF